MFILKTVLATFGSIIIMFLISKLLGNKQISELNLFDYINGITIGSIASEMAVSSNYKELWTSATAMVIYGLTGFLLSIWTIKSIKARRFFSGTPLLLIEDGKIYPENIKTAKLDTGDLLTRARNSGYFDISQIAYAILENNGKISFMPKTTERPITLKDLGQERPDEKLVTNVILDGVVMEGNLKYTGNDMKWLLKEMHKQGFSDPSDIFLGTVDQNNSLTLYPQYEHKVMKDYFN
ncbi:MAG: DUF421 domain-containing protein [Oscillospiraceae bacterium]